MGLEGKIMMRIVTMSRTEILQRGSSMMAMYMAVVGTGRRRRVSRVT